MQPRHRYEPLGGARTSLPQRGGARGSASGALPRAASQLDCDRAEQPVGGFRSWWPFGRASREAERRTEERAAPDATPGSPAVVPPPLPLRGGLRETPRWMPDDKCQRCFRCDVHFGAFKRRHHCRLCGQIFCHSCSSHFIAGQLIGRREQQSRLCEACTNYCDGLAVHDARPRTSLGRESMGSQSPLTESANLPSRARGEQRSFWFSSMEDDDVTPEESEGGQEDLPQVASTTDEPWTASDTRSFHSESGASGGEEDLDGLMSTWYWGDHALPVQPAAAKLPAAATQHMEEMFLEESPAPVEPQKMAAAHGTAWRKMSESACRHFSRSVRECCARIGGGLEDPAHVRCICELAQQVVVLLSPAEGDSMDILQYVKVKRIPSPGGQIQDSVVVDGVVFSRDVAHRKMHSSIINCTLALLRETLSFDGEQRLTRLDDLRRQEAFSMELKVGKIADDLKPRPHLLLCQGGVSRIAQEKLRDRNISLVLGVPSHILDAVSRSTGADVLPSVDSIAVAKRAPLVGYCGAFTVRRTGEVGEAGSKTLAFVEGGAQPGQFATVCLRGEDLALLSRAKQALKWAIRLARHMQLESELHFEMWLEPWQRPPPTEPEDFLDVACFFVSQKDMTCSKPTVLRLPAYASPPGQLSAAQQAGWAGGLGVPLEGFKDCTLCEWLKRCFTQQSAALGAFGESEAARATLSDASCLMDGTAVGAGAADTLMESPRHAGAAAVAARKELPTPSSTQEILCLQHRRSRIVVFITDNEVATRTIRARGMSMAELREVYAARTRWALLQREGMEEPGDANGNLEEVEMWQWCKQCKSNVIPRSAISPSASLHSSTRFLEMLLHNGSSECSKLSECISQDQCDHPACRNHVLFFSSPERPLTVGLFWEHVTCWRLLPHQPYWDPRTRLLRETPEASGAAADADSALLTQLQQLAEKLDVLVRCILVSLGTAKPAGGGAPPRTWDDSFPATHMGAGTAEPAGERVLGSQGAWRRVAKQLVRHIAQLRFRLAEADGKLRQAEHACPILNFYVQRDLVDTLREDLARAREAFGEASLRTALAALQKRPAAESRRSTLVQPLSYLWCSLANSSMKNFWPGSSLLQQAESNEAVAEPNGLPSQLSSISGRGRRRRAGAERSGAWFRTSSADSDLRGAAENVPELLELSMRTEQATKALEEAEESALRLAALERGVQGLCLPVREDDAGSLIAHALLSRQCHEQMAAQWAAATGGSSSSCPLAQRDYGGSCFSSFPSPLMQDAPCQVPASSSSSPPQLSPREARCASLCLADTPWKRLPGVQRSSWEEQWERKGVRAVLTAMPLEQPVKVEFEDRQAKYSVAIHHAAQYHMLRHWLCGDDLNFARSLYRCSRIKPSGGKTGASFFVSQQRRFLLKAVNAAEFKMLTTPSRAQAMFSYVDQVLFEKLPSVLAHVVGLFSVTVKLHAKSRESKESRTKHFIVQRNLRFSLQNQKRQHFVFDLKGVGNRRKKDPAPSSSAGRDDSDADEPSTDQAAGPGRPVLWDVNLREWTDGKPLCVASRDLTYLEAALHNDTHFLSKLSLIDYSLLLAAAQPQAGEEEGTLALGIIDWLRPYTWDKFGETVVKTLVQSDRPTVIEPPKYARRFLDAMSTFFIGETPAGT